VLEKSGEPYSIGSGAADGCGLESLPQHGAAAGGDAGGPGPLPGHLLPSGKLDRAGCNSRAGTRGSPPRTTST
jgi:hypothetical protein